MPNAIINLLCIPMMFLMISCFSFILLLSKSLSLNIILLRLSSLIWFYTQLTHMILNKMAYHTFSKSDFLKQHHQQEDDEQAFRDSRNYETGFLDLPELAMEAILELLPPASLSNMAQVSNYFRDRCTSDDLWEKHMKLKWDRLIGEAAYDKWLNDHNAASRKRPNGIPAAAVFGCGGAKRNRTLLCGYVSSLLCPLVRWSSTLSVSESGHGCDRLVKRNVAVDAPIMAFYIALETGRFWFPAQVFNREHGNIGFMLSCYDAEVSYDSDTDTFRARYSTQGRRTFEDNMTWDRLRLSPVTTSAYDLHATTCLDDLAPGDHIEIQWRRIKDFPYGWWYGVVAHSDDCSGNPAHCQCQLNDTVILEFKQYSIGSRWRRAAINRKDHKEIGNEADGFYGGIRKICNDDEIVAWKRFCPPQAVEQ